MNPNVTEEPSVLGSSVISRTTDSIHFYYRRHEISDRSSVSELLKEVQETFSGLDDVQPMMLVDFGSVEGGISIEVGITTDGPIEVEGFDTKVLGPEEVLCGLHRGDYGTIRETYLEMYSEMRNRGIVPQTRSREVVLELDPEDPGSTVVEIQWPLHDWTGLLAKGVEETLGQEAKDHVMEGVKTLTLDTAREERFEWVRAALLRLDGIADEEQKYWAVSVCADRYPAWRLEKLRQVYLDTGSVDQVLEDMKGDTEWYSTPYREGTLIYHTKVPYDREAWEAATDRESKRRAYCHCALVQDRLDEMSPTYCYCGTGWVRQVWEGVLQRPIRVEVLKSLPAGDDECQFLIHLPEDVVGGDG